MFSCARIRLTAEAYELPWREVVEDARVVWTWRSPFDDLVVWLSKRHQWNAETSVVYLAALRRIRDPRDGNPTMPPGPTRS